jgi:CcmD family protein
MTPGVGNWNYIIAAFAIAWIGIGGYWLHASGRLRRVRAEYERAVRSGGALR